MLVAHWLVTTQHDCTPTVTLVTTHTCSIELARGTEYQRCWAAPQASHKLKSCSTEATESCGSYPNFMVLQGCTHMCIQLRLLS
jgi:hypothetical protein